MVTVESFFHVLRLPLVLQEERAANTLPPVVPPAEAEAPFPEEAPPFRDATIHQIAVAARNDWRNMPVSVKPYLAAMFSLDSINDHYGFDSGKSVVSSFLSFTAQWKGETARQIKAELRRRLR